MTLEEAATVLSDHHTRIDIQRVREAIVICLKALDEYAALKRNLAERRKQMIED